MIIYDFFSGTGSSTQAFKDAGHTVISFEIDQDFNATENVDVLTLNAQELIAKYGQPDFVWASPPCTSFSVASIGHHWANGGENPVPKTEAAKSSQDLIAHTLRLLQELNPSQGWLMENPRGMLRKLPVVKGFPRATITYCQYGESRMKPTDLWGSVKGWTPRPACKNGMPCHESAPRGAKTGTQGLKSAKNRSRIPLALSQEILQVIQSNKEGNK
jgi:hypothetical protein